MADVTRFGTVGRMAHGDFEPAMPEGTPVVLLRRHPDPEYDLEVAFIDADTGAASTTALSESDVDFDG
jgi:hypothetical protein